MGGGALGRIAFAGVLLDDDPAIESYDLQRADDGRNIDHPAPERAEDDLAQGVGKTPAGLPCLGQDRRIDVLEVQMTDQSAVFADERGWVAATVGIMAGVEGGSCAGSGPQVN